MSSGLAWHPRHPDRQRPSRREDVVVQYGDPSEPVFLDEAEVLPEEVECHFADAVGAAEAEGELLDAYRAEFEAAQERQRQAAEGREAARVSSARWPCEHLFALTSQGSPATRFRRAVERRSVVLAELAAREMGRLPLKEAVALVELYAATGDPKFPRAAARLLGRIAHEHPVRLADLQVIAALLADLPDRPDRAELVVELLRDLPRRRG